MKLIRSPRPNAFRWPRSRPLILCASKQVPYFLSLLSLTTLLIFTATSWNYRGGSSQVQEEDNLLISYTDAEATAVAYPNLVEASNTLNETTTTVNAMLNEEQQLQQQQMNAQKRQLLRQQRLKRYCL